MIELGWPGLNWLGLFYSSFSDGVGRINLKGSGFEIIFYPHFLFYTPQVSYPKALLELSLINPHDIYCHNFYIDTQ